ncbi:hypothetical protein [Flavihumibacter sp.]|uniref:hypothetical protein n=1 Tax=Flavihumibacter sp. TaxID=1913981 RepID=UPI002FCB997C
MPTDRNQALDFLESQWSPRNLNKIKGVAAEIRFERHLRSPHLVNQFQYIVPGGWIFTPTTNAFANPVTAGRVAVLTVPTSFSWTIGLNAPPIHALSLAQAYFNQVGIPTYFSKFDTGGNTLIESSFNIPCSPNYPVPYLLDFFQIIGSGLTSISLNNGMSAFKPKTTRSGNFGYTVRRIYRHNPIWKDTAVITSLFWKEYTRYFIKTKFSGGAADLDFFIVGNSGRAFPVEFKSKSVVIDSNYGDWFGIDFAPFAKLSFFVSLSLNMEAIYFVEEVDILGLPIAYWGIKFTELLKCCDWVNGAGGENMSGGASSTVKIPKVKFQSLPSLLSSL